MSVCPFWGHSPNTLPDLSTPLPVQVGLEYITRIFWEKYGSIVQKSFDRGAEIEKRWEFWLQRKELKTFLLDHPSFQEGKLLDTIYHRAYAELQPLAPLNRLLWVPEEDTALWLIHRIREAITQVAEEILKPKSTIERRIVDNIMWPLAPWECTITSIVPFYEKHRGTEVFTQAWKTITQVNALIGTHLATRHISSVVDQLVITISDSGWAAPYFLISWDHGDTEMTWRPNAISEITSILNKQDWEEIIHDPETRKGPLTVCPAALVKTSNETTMIELWVEKIGNVLLQALFP